MELILPIVCSISLLSIIAALIFNSKFRQDILTTQGEASIFKILTVKGVAVIILTGLFLGGLIWSFSNIKRNTSSDLTVALSNSQISSINEVNYKIQNIEARLMNFYTNEYIPAFAQNFISLLPANTDFKNDIRDIIEAASSTNVKGFEKANKQLQKLRDKCYSSINHYFTQINISIQDGNNEYKRLIKQRPLMLDSLSKLDESIIGISNGRNEKLDDYFQLIEKYLLDKTYNP